MQASGPHCDEWVLVRLLGLEADGRHMCLQCWLWRGHSSQEQSRLPSDLGCVSATVHGMSFRVFV